MNSRLAIDGGTPVREQFLVFGQPVLGQEEIDEIVDTLKSAWIGTGPRTQRFEKAFAAYIGTSNALAVNSCTAGLHLALLAAKVGPGDEVPVTALTFVASSNVIVHCGATPVFVDIDPNTLNLDLADLERKITGKTKAVMPVHFAGLPVDLASLDSIVLPRSIKVIEDAAHAVGASINGKKIGSGKNLTAFSFYANKNMTTGEGGMLTANGLGADTLDYLVAMRLHGLSNDAWRRFHTKAMIQSDVIGAGYKYNMTDLQAALGLHQLQRLEGFLVKREAIAARYRRELADLSGIRFQEIPQHYGRLRHGLHLFVLLLERKAFRVDRDTVIAALRAENIGATVHYGSVPTHRYYRQTFPDAHRGTPVANEVGDTILSLPLRPDFTERDTADVVEAVRKVLRHYAR
jgi:dTDP-4-amino-4,6-dideoxygalactose transaminase